MSRGAGDMTASSPPTQVLILRSEPPLPAFCMPFPIPPPTSDISVLRLSVLRILTGQKNPSAPQLLTHSELLKQMTVQGWRLRMLELVQVQAGSAADRDDEVELGLTLLDEHKCSALEHGDEIVVKLHPGFTLAELQLPDLGAGYDYSVSPDEQAIYAAPAYTLTHPTEPSSHSSSVQANPTTNYQAFQYPDYRQGYKVLYTQGSGHGIVSRTPAGLGPLVTDTRDCGIESHQLAQLKGLARSNGAAGEMARAKLAELGEPIPDFRTAKAKKHLPKLPADSSLLVPSASGMPSTALAPPVTKPIVSEMPSTTAPAVPAAATMPLGTTPAVAHTAAAVPAPTTSVPRMERTTRLPQERVRLQRDTNTRSPFVGLQPRTSSAPKLTKKKKKATRSQLFGTVKATLQSRNPTATSQLFVPLYAAPFLGMRPQGHLTKPQRSGLLRNRDPDETLAPPEAAPVQDAAGVPVPTEHVPAGGLAAVGVPMEEDAPMDHVYTELPTRAGLGVDVPPYGPPPGSTVPPYGDMPGSRVRTSAEAYVAELRPTYAPPKPTTSVPVPEPLPLPEPVPSVMPTTSQGAQVERNSSIHRLFHTPMPGQAVADAHAITHDKRASLRAARDGAQEATWAPPPAVPEPQSMEPVVLAAPPVPPKGQGSYGVPVSQGTYGIQVPETLGTHGTHGHHGLHGHHEHHGPDHGSEALLAPLSQETPLPPFVESHKLDESTHSRLEPLTHQISYAEPVPEEVVTHAPVDTAALPPPLSHEVLSQIPVTSLDPAPAVVPQVPVVPTVPEVPATSVVREVPVVSTIVETTAPTTSAASALSLPAPASLPYLSSQRTLVSPADQATTVLPARESVHYSTPLSSLPPPVRTNLVHDTTAVLSTRSAADEYAAAPRAINVPEWDGAGRVEAVAHRDTVLSRAHADDMERQWAEFEAQCRLNREAGLPPPSLLR
ncbi:dihydrofolate synthase [Malassezia nana]|uniref:Dihydrofolate synthase n=1 Tax=Malassezia nana TaxID=180528 RepID=A0AAF0J7T7_9BASI|nr:dihydrofolate synthase [Malassezia nana]